MQLAIDSSTPIASLSVRGSDSKIFSIEATDPNSHIETLSDLLEQLLKTAKVKTKDITSIVLGEGPGSFTGLRIGYSFASGLAFALKVPVITISSLQAAISIESAKKLNVVLTDARRGEFFTGIYQLKDQDLEKYIPENIMTQRDLESFLDQKLAELNLNSSEIALFSNQPLSLLGQINSQSFSGLSANLLRLGSRPTCKIPSFSVLELSKLNPNYLRAVAAVKLKDPRRISFSSIDRA